MVCVKDGVTEYDVGEVTICGKGEVTVYGVIKVTVRDNNECVHGLG